MRWSTADAITPQTVDGLRPVWTWRTGERRVANPAGGDPLRPGRFQATPLMVSGTLYLSTPYNRVVALDAVTGRERWAYDPGATRFGLIGDDRSGFVHRGVALWRGDGRMRVFLASRWWLVALDADTGRPIESFGDHGRVDLSQGLRWPVNQLHLGNTSPPVVFGDSVIVGSSVADRVMYERDPPGAVLAFDVRTGKRLWRWDAVPPEGHPDRSSWGGRSAAVTGHTNVWAGMSLDAGRGLLYVPVSTPSNDWYGGRRPGHNLYADSLVCLDAASGRLVWHRQLVHHGLWDYDVASSPLLVTIRRDGIPLDAVFVAGKTGFLYAFDRVSGEPVWPLVERPVPSSDVPGEAASPTQPHPAWPRPFAKQGFSSDDVVDFSPALEQQALAILEGRRMGPLFTPPSREGSIVLPGWIGGAGWGSTAVDLDRRTLFVKATNMPSLARVTPDADLGYRVDPSIVGDLGQPLLLPLAGAPDENGHWWDPDTLPILKPPYGTLTAFDIDSGDIRWQVTLGDMPYLRRHPALRGLTLPQLGVPGTPGGAATRGGLVFITGGGGTLYAIDARDGAVRWSAPLEANGYSNPMTYELNGRQYVVIAAGEDESAVLHAFVLAR
jgi:quinoprotein glucose dehydrogenase